MEVKFHVFMISVLVWDEWSSSHLPALPRYPLDRRLDVSYNRSGRRRKEKNLDYRDSNTHYSTVKPAANRYTNWAMGVVDILINKMLYCSIAEWNEYIFMTKNFVVTEQMDCNAGLTECGIRKMCVYSLVTEIMEHLMIIFCHWCKIVCAIWGSHGDNCQEYWCQERDIV
jgi:hypothetical protein